MVAEIIMLQAGKDDAWVRAGKSACPQDTNSTKEKAVLRRPFPYIMLMKSSNMVGLSAVEQQDLHGDIAQNA